MVAEQWCRSCSVGERERREGETEERSCCSLHRKTQLGQTACSVVVAAWGGVGRNEGKTGREGESTRQGHGKDRPQAYCVFLCLGGGTDIMFPHQHTAAVTGGHQQRPVKEKH